MDLPLPDHERKILASILLKDEQELTAERLEGAVKALRRIHLRRKLEHVQRELQGARNPDPGRLNELLNEKMRLKRALTDPGAMDDESAPPAA